MFKRHLQMVVSLSLAAGLTACGGTSGSLPITTGSSLIGTSGGASSSVRSVSSTQSNAASPYTYTAPWGGFGGSGQIYVLPQGACGDIGASPASGFAWPAFLGTLKSGTIITITGTAAYSNAWGQANNCPTGGIVATNVVVGSPVVLPAPSPSPGPATTAVAINAGGVGIPGWSADADFLGGSVWSTSASVQTSQVTSPAPPSVYKKHRFARTFGYTIPQLTPHVTYLVRLHFAEIYFNAAGKRAFNVAINGTQVLTGFDVVAATGGENIAIAKQFAAIADANGRITIDFSATINNAMISGIELIRSSGSPTPVPTVAPSPVPSPIITTAPGTSNYPAPWPHWNNALGLTKLIDPSKAAQHIKSYDAAAVNFYSNWNPGWVNIGGGVSGWNSNDNYEVTSGAGAGYYVASNSDPVYNLTCAPGGYCGYSNGLTGMHIPNGARTQNSGARNCDCHIYVLQPVGWTPGSTTGINWPKLAAPYQYEIDIENAATSAACVGQATTSCTTFNGGGNIYAWGSVAFSTGSTGWYGGQNSSINDGFSPANAPPTTKWGGSADHSNTPFTALVITAEDLLQGAINHETGMGMVCSENPQSDSWPAAIVGTDFPCSNISGNAKGWSYGDHIWLERTPSQIQSDVANHILTPIQAVLATSFSQYGAIIFDNAGSWGPTYQVNTSNGDPLWNQVGQKYNLPRTSETIGGVTTSGVLINMGLPMSYMKAYAHAIDSCVLKSTC